MAKRGKFSVEFEGFSDAVARIIELGGKVDKVVDKALEATHEYVTEQAREAMQPRYLPAKGRYAHGERGTLGTIVPDAKVEWSGTIASDKVGFDISNGGLASIFLMYGTPRMKKDSKLYSAFYGSKTKKEIVKIQEDLFYNEIGRLQ